MRLGGASRLPNPILTAFSLATVLALCACPPPIPTPDAGPTWTPAFDTSSTGWLLNVGGTAPDDLYAVGGRADAGLLLHFGGSAWAPVALPADVPLLNWVHAFSAQDAFAVGKQGTILHFDGAAWARQTSPTTQDLWGIWGATPSDVWAVGGDGQEPHATLLHFDGAAWTVQALPPLQKLRVGQLLKVWGTSADNVYVVGQRGVVLHFQMGQWKEELVGANDDLVSVWGVSPDAIVAVGGRANGIASVWNGVKWTTTSLSPVVGLNGVWLRDDRTAFVAGANGTLGHLDLRTMQFFADHPGVNDDFHSVFGMGAMLYAVGGNLVSANPAHYVGLALQRELGANE